MARVQRRLRRLGGNALRTHGRRRARTTCHRVRRTGKPGGGFASATAFGRTRSFALKSAPTGPGRDPSPRYCRRRSLARLGAPGRSTVDRAVQALPMRGPRETLKPSGSSPQESRLAQRRRGYAPRTLAPTRATEHAGNLPVELTSFVGRRQGLADLKRALRLDPAADAHRRRRRRQDQARPAGRPGERPPVPRRRLVRRAGADPGPRARPAGRVRGAWAPGPLVELGGLHPQRLSRRQATPPDPRQLRARPRRRGRPGGNAPARLSRSCGSWRRAGRPSGSPARSSIDVPTLSLPEDGDASPEALLRSDAVALFVERAGAVEPGFAVDAANAAAILSVCTHLDGIPLALELAAVRLNALGLDALDRGLTARLGALGTGDRSAVAPAADARGRDRLELPAPERARATAVGPPVGVRRRLRARRGPGGLCRRRPGRRGDPGARRVARREVGAQATTGRRRRPLPAPRTASPVRPRAAPGGRRARQSFAHAIETGSSTLAAVAGANDARQVEAFERIRTERAQPLDRARLLSLRIRPRRRPARRSAGTSGSTGLRRDRPPTFVACFAALLESIAGTRSVAGRAAVDLGVFSVPARGPDDRRLGWRPRRCAIGRAIGDPDIVAWSLQTSASPRTSKAAADDAIITRRSRSALAKTMGSRFLRCRATVLLAVRRTPSVAATSTRGSRSQRGRRA